jgi:hypothetical protein
MPTISSPITCGPMARAANATGRRMPFRVLRSVLMPLRAVSLAQVPLSPPGGHVAIVIGDRSFAQVVPPNAKSIVAFMQRARLRPPAMVQKECESVRKDGPLANSESPISAIVTYAGPDPARGGHMRHRRTVAFDLLGEPFSKRSSRVDPRHRHPSRMFGQAPGCFNTAGALHSSTGASP